MASEATTKYHVACFASPTDCSMDLAGAMLSITRASDAVWITNGHFFLLVSTTGVITTSLTDVSPRLTTDNVIAVCSSYLAAVIALVLSMKRNLLALGTSFAAAASILSFTVTS